MIKRNTVHYNKNPQRRKIGGGLAAENENCPRTPIAVVDVTLGTTTVVELDQSVVLNGIPQYASSLGALPTAAAIGASPNLVNLTYAVAPLSLSVPFEDHAIRNGAGGYVQPGTFPVE